MHFLKKLFSSDDTELKAQTRRLMPSVLVEQTSAMLLGMINMMVIGTVSSAALAGVGQVNAFNNVVVLFFNSFSLGGTILVAQRIGARDTEGARKCAAQSLLFGGIASLAVTVVLFFVRVPLLTALFGAADADVMQHTLNYYAWSLLATPFWFIVFQCAGAMRGAGDTKTPMRVSLTMNAVNIVSSLTFVMVFRLSSTGVGIAVLISVAVGAALSLRAIWNRESPVCLRDVFSLKPDLGVVQNVVSVGLPTGIENLMFNGGKLILQTFISGMGTAMISAFQAANQSVSLVSIPVMSLNVLVVTLVGQRAGTGDRDKTRHALLHTLSKSFLWCLASSVVMLAFARLFVLLFSRDPDVVYISTRALWIYAAFMPFWAPAFILPAGFRGVRDVKYGLVVSTVIMWVVRVFGAYIFSVTLGWAVYGVFFAMCLDWVFRTAAFCWRLRGDAWLHKVYPPTQ